jgi:cold-inducible RNA-binding protein
VSSKLFVGNLSYNTTEESLRTLFSEFGEVTSVNVINDKFTGNSRGFGFVEMENADAAIAALNNKEVDGRPIRVDIAKAKEQRDDGGRSGGRFHGGGGRRGDRGPNAY